MRRGVTGGSGEAGVGECWGLHADSANAADRTTEKGSKAKAGRQHPKEEAASAGGTAPRTTSAAASAACAQRSQRPQAYAHMALPAPSFMCAGLRAAHWYLMGALLLGSTPTGKSAT